MSWLLSPLLFRKFGSETINAAYAKKSLARSLLVSSLKDDARVHSTASAQGFQWRPRHQDNPHLPCPPNIAQGTFPLPEGKVGAHWPLDVPVHSVVYPDPDPDLLSDPCFSSRIQL
jgi:hypothetical protein